jgi:hypothetical protein
VQTDLKPEDAMQLRLKYEFLKIKLLLCTFFSKATTLYPGFDFTTHGIGARERFKSLSPVINIESLPLGLNLPLRGKL